MRGAIGCYGRSASLVCISGLALALSLQALAAVSRSSSQHERHFLGGSVTSTVVENPDPAVAATLSRLRGKVTGGATVPVIVGVRAAFAPEGLLSSLDTRRQRSDIAQAQSDLLARLSRATVQRAKRYQAVPFVALEVSAAELEALAADPAVTDLQEDLRAYKSLAQSVPIIRADQAWAAGQSGIDGGGNGWAVALLDDGVQDGHPFIASAIVSEACYSTQSGKYKSLCPGGVSSSTEPGSAANCSSSTYGDWACGHGTHVAGIAAGNGGDAGKTFSGVARDGDLVAIQVFSWDSGSNDSVAFFSDINRALEQVLNLVDSGVRIASVNMSLGGGGYTSQASCDSAAPSTRALIDTLRSRGVVTVVASGNDGYTDRVSVPGCLTPVVSVGSTWDDTGGWACSNTDVSVIDKVACYSNTAGFLDLLAPGSAIESSVPTSAYAVYHGTSMATPHVAGCWAVLKAARPDATVDQIENALKNTGKAVADYRDPGIVTPRIDCKAALDVLLAPEPPPPAPVLNVSILGGGTVTGAGINCPGDCTETFAGPSTVTLTATPATGYAFTGWSGACSGGESCTVSVSGTTAVMATFSASGQSVALGSAAFTVTEGTSSVVIPVTRSSSAGSATVSFNTIDGSALAGQDYTAKSGTLSFASGVLTLNVSVGITNDSLAENDEKFSLQLGNPSAGLALGTPSSATVTIRDDGDSNIGFGLAGYSVVESAGTVTLWVSRTGDTGRAASVRYATANGSARSSSDYRGKSGTLKWGAGDTADKAITIAIVNNSTRESTENFSVRLSWPSGATLGSIGTATVTIVDDD